MLRAWSSPHYLRHRGHGQRRSDGGGVPVRTRRPIRTIGCGGVVLHEEHPEHGRSPGGLFSRRVPAFGVFRIHAALLRVLEPTSGRIVRRTVPYTSPERRVDGIWEWDVLPGRMFPSAPGIDFLRGNESLCYVVPRCNALCETIVCLQ